MDILNEMDDEIRKVVMYDKKIEIEYFLGNNIIRRSKEWEELRTKHINDYSKVVIGCNCIRCGGKSCKVFDFFDYLKILTHLDRKGDSSFTCRTCGIVDNVFLSIAPVSLALIPLQSNRTKNRGYGSPWYLDYL